jgi:hypothetical protein
VHVQDTSSLQGGTHSLRNLGDHKGWTSKGQKTRNLGSFNNNDTQTAGERILSDGNDMANSYQESASRDRSTGGYSVENVVSHQPRVKETGRRDSNDRTRSNDGDRVRDNNVGYPPYELQPARRQNFFRESVLLEVTKRWEVNAYHLTRRGVKQGREITDKTRGGVRATETESCQPIKSSRDTQRPQLVDDRPRFQNVKDRPVFFPTSPEWFHLGSQSSHFLYQWHTVVEVFDLNW